MKREIEPLASDEMTFDAKLGVWRKCYVSFSFSDGYMVHLGSDGLCETWKPIEPSDLWSVIIEDGDDDFLEAGEERDPPTPRGIAAALTPANDGTAPLCHVSDGKLKWYHGEPVTDFSVELRSWNQTIRGDAITQEEVDAARPQQEQYEQCEYCGWIGPAWKFTNGVCGRCFDDGVIDEPLDDEEYED